MTKQNRNARMPIIIPNQDFYNNSGWFSSTWNQESEIAKNRRNKMRQALTSAPLNSLIQRKPRARPERIRSATRRAVYPQVAAINN